MALTLASPIKGWVTPLDEVPDVVFAGRILGAGLAIDPVDQILSAPCEALVANVHWAGHAITLRAAGGVEILIHIGLETVRLNGRGFEVHVGEGQKVGCGAKLISFDLDFLARRARSLITPVVVTAPDGFAIGRQAGHGQIDAGGFLIELTPKRKEFRS